MTAAMTQNIAVNSNGRPPLKKSTVTILIELLSQRDLPFLNGVIIEATNRRHPTAAMIQNIARGFSRRTCT